MGTLSAQTVFCSPLLIVTRFPCLAKRMQAGIRIDWADLPGCKTSTLLLHGKAAPALLSPTGPKCQQQGIGSLWTPGCFSISLLFFSSSCFIFPSVFSIPKQHLASWHRPDAAQNSSKPHTHLWLFSFHQKWTMVLKPTSTNELSKSRCHLYGTVCFFLYKEALAHSSAPQFLERCNEMRTPHSVHQLNYSSSIPFLTLPRKVLSSLS